MRRPNRLVAETLFPAVAVAGLVFMLHYVPFYAPSFLAWTGIAAALAALVSLARPLRFLGVRTRVPGLALALALCGVGLAVTAVLWSWAARPPSCRTTRGDRPAKDGNGPDRGRDLEAARGTLPRRKAT